MSFVGIPKIEILSEESQEKIVTENKNESLRFLHAQLDIFVSCLNERDRNGYNPLIDSQATRELTELIQNPDFLASKETFEADLTNLEPLIHAFCTVEQERQMVDDPQNLRALQHTLIDIKDQIETFFDGEFAGKEDTKELAVLKDKIVSDAIARLEYLDRRADGLEKYLDSR